MYRLTTAFLLSAALVLPALAQDPDVTGTLVNHWKTSKKYVLALADQMPAADYSFKPNPDEMSFGEQMAHIATSNAFFFSTLSGQKNPIGKPKDFDKASVLKLLNASYDFVVSALEDLPLERLHETFTSPEARCPGWNYCCSQPITPRTTADSASFIYAPRISSLSIINFEEG
jgi:hypothetical protein